MPKGNVEAKVFAIAGEVPKSPRKSGYTRKGEIDAVLQEVAAENDVGVAVCIRQYDKKESASGTLYNLRKRQKADPPVNPYWTFELGDLGQLDETMAGKIGLFATRTA